MINVILKDKKVFLSLYLFKIYVMLSISTKYAIKAVLYLAVNSTVDKKILAKEISAPTGVPKAYLSKILQELSRHDIISSVKGPNGGFYLTAENQQTSLIKIVDLIDGEHRLKSCILSIQNCNSDHPCPLHNMVGNTKSRFISKLETTSIHDLVNDIKIGKSNLPL
ncbi:transcriptional regulator, BadM/Rrf2 family [Cellulophaga tyrosinoxydans]|uniref:Transcriptional regulator, BadM/Rrf2 family n=2 Tax=Cellulophaga tyrosinoxydans TaxID=504486 RepID=A0A1W2A2F4_9FLAO|nr:transcriptional regulator, BadM/Rrf2 family [Cellulophaga tyrosinoxydans]